MQIILATIFIYMSFWFLISLIWKRNDVADIAWGLGFVVATLVAFLQQDFIGLRSIIVLILISIWGLRLSFHIAKRNIHKSEDARYAAWRSEWKHFFIRSFLQVFMLQGLLMFLILIPTILINRRGANLPLNYIDALGVLIWIIGFCFESLGDAQLARFLKNPENKGKILNTGLWKYTRHPNYFGEVTMWWGIWILSLSAYPSLYSIIGPLSITFLILKISGVPMLEKRMIENPLFDNYRKTTPMFVPFVGKR